MIANSIATAEDLLRHGAINEAVAELQQARMIDAPAIERYELGEALLRASNGRLGWDLYDLHPSRPQDRLAGLERWQGEPCDVLVVVAEQGFGDAIQFLRFIPAVADRAERVVLAMHDELVDATRSSPLLAGLEIAPKSEARRTSWPSTARWERLMSLPVRLPQFQVEPIGKYLLAPPARAGLRLPPQSTGCLTIGVAWRSTQRRGFPGRSFPARLIPTLAATGRVRVVALHRNQDIRATSHGAETVDIRDFTDTAAVIAQCDCVVTADTVTAHLAPALGVPTFVCLRHRADWRWGTPANPTAWYARSELLFQDATQRWEPVLSIAAQRIQQSLPVVIGCRGHAVDRY